MTRTEVEFDQRSSDQIAFEHDLRTGQRLTSAEWERKFNPYHDPEDGRFTFAPGGLTAGMAARRQLDRVERTAQGRAGQSGDVPAAPRRPRASTDAQASTSSTSLGADDLRSIMPGAGKRADELADPIDKAMAHYGINSPEQKAAFLAQVFVESGQLHAMDENLRYSAEGLHKTFPDRFPTVESAKPYVGNVERIANRAYAGKGGNGDEASGDGYKYRGRGILQITGKYNYTKLGFDKNPNAVLRPFHGAFAAAGYWKMRRLNERTNVELNRRQFDRVVGRVNAAGLNGDLRWAAYQRALKAFRSKEKKE